jgi:rubrerythrin
MGKIRARRARRVDMRGESMLEGSGQNVETEGSRAFGDVLAAGEAAAGEFHCSTCGYGVIVQRELPRCPMCRGTAWEQAGWGAIRRRATARLQ